MIHYVPGLTNWPIYSQDRGIASPDVTKEAETRALPALVKLWQAIEAQTGYKWRCTSYWRNSPSHVTGTALDIAPEVSEASEKYYAVTNASDPVLYKRERLIRDLQDVAKMFRLPEFHAGIFIEPDHLHLQLFHREQGSPPTRVFKWKVPKPVYGDTLQRMRLPLIRTFK